MHIVTLCGSLRADSINKILAMEAAKLAEGMTLELEPIDSLPLYNQDTEAIAFPAEATHLKERIASAAGVLIFTPEFNRGIPGPLKNALDWTSRPDGTHPWRGKPVGVLGASSGPRGAVVAQYDIKRMMLYFGAHVMGTPEFYVDNSNKKIDGGTVRDEKTKEYLIRYLQAFKQHVGRFV